MLWDLHWLPIIFCAQLKVLVLTYGALYGLGPGYLKECLLQYHLTCALWSIGEALLSVMLAYCWALDEVPSCWLHHIFGTFFPWMPTYLHP